MKNATTGTQQPNKILFAVDETTHSGSAADAVAALALKARATVKVLHVLDFGAQKSPEYTDVSVHLVARHLVEHIAGQLADRGVTVTTELCTARHGKVAEVIAAVANEDKANFVALGSRGRSDLNSLVLGSVSHHVLGLVQCPVLIVRQPAQGEQHSEIRRVLVAVAGGDEASHAREAAFALGAGAEILVLHVQGLATAEGMAWIESRKEASITVERIAGELRSAGFNAQSRVAPPSSFVAQDIARIAAEWNADLIVVGSRRLSDLGALLAGSTSHELIHAADRPVLIAELAVGHGTTKASLAARSAMTRT